MAFVTIQQKRNEQNALLLCVIRFMRAFRSFYTCSRMEKGNIFIVLFELLSLGYVRPFGWCTMNEWYYVQQLNALNPSILLYAYIHFRHRQMVLAERNGEWRRFGHSFKFKCSPRKFDAAPLSLHVICIKMRFNVILRVHDTRETERTTRLNSTLKCLLDDVFYCTHVLTARIFHWP